LAGRILGNEACSILKRGGNYNNNNKSEECCRCIVNVSCHKCYSVYLCDSYGEAYVDKPKKAVYRGRTKVLNH